MRREDHESAPVVGTRTIMQNAPQAGGFVLRPTQLISARVNKPRQWVVTISQATPAVPNVSPWPAPSDGTPFTTGFQGLQSTAGLLRCALRWGAGGTAFQTEFDYPLQGGSFGVLADTLDLNVKLGVDPVAFPVPTADEIPVIGAFMVPGVAADPTPLRWLEPATANPNPGVNVFWSVKPYARAVHINVYQALANSYTIQMGGYNRTLTGDSDNVYLIPSYTSFLRVLNGAGSPKFNVSWLIGLT